MGYYIFRKESERKLNGASVKGDLRFHNLIQSVVEKSPVHFSSLGVK